MASSTKEPESQRERGIEAWWGQGHPGLPLAYTRKEQVKLRRLFKAFRRALSALSEEQFQRFWLLGPTVVCRPHDNGVVFRHVVTVISDAETAVQRSVPVLYLAPWVFRRSDKSLADLVAHEVAHLVLGHHEGSAGSIADVEEAAET